MKQTIITYDNKSKDNLLSCTVEIHDENGSFITETNDKAENQSLIFQQLGAFVIAQYPNCYVLENMY